MSELDGPIIGSQEELAELQSKLPRTRDYLVERFNAILLETNEVYTGNDAVNVNMENYGISKDKVIGTAGTADCVGVILYNPTRHLAVVVHLNASTDPWKTLQTIALDLGVPPQELQAYVWGGVVDETFPISVELARRTVDTLDRSGITITAANLLAQGQSRISGLFINPLTGQLFSKAPHAQRMYKESIGSGEGFSIAAAKAFDGRAAS